MGDFNKNNEKCQRNTTGAEQEGMIFFSLYFFRREKMFKVFASITDMILLDTFFLIEIHNS
jgi:hypothetical protein